MTVIIRITNYCIIPAFYQKAEVDQDEKKPNHLIVAMTSDRGLCGSAHSNIVRAIKAAVPLKPAGTSFKIIAIGDKARGMLGRLVRSRKLTSLHCPKLKKFYPPFIIWCLNSAQLNISLSVSNIIFCI